MNSHINTDSMKIGVIGIGMIGSSLAALFTGAVSFLALLFTGTFTAFGHELLLMLLYLWATVAMCDLLRRIVRKAEVLAILLPLFMLLVIGTCPVFLNFRKFRAVAHFLPAFYYLQGVHSLTYTRGLLLTALILTALDAAAFFIEMLADTRRGSGKRGAAV